MSEWEPTMNLRWVMRRPPWDSAENRILQQKWVKHQWIGANDFIVIEEWRNVPVEQES